MLAALMQNSANIEMIEYLMAAFWILLRNGGNRKLLSEAFETNPMDSPEKKLASGKSTKIKQQLQARPTPLPSRSPCPHAAGIMPHLLYLCIIQP